MTTAQVQRPSVTVDDAINYLNDLLQIAPAEIQTLVALRIPAPQSLVEHETVQVQSPTVALDGPPVVGLLGILNGLFGTDLDGAGPIAAVYDEDWNIVKFQHNWHANSVMRLAVEAVIADVASTTGVNSDG